MLNLEGVRYIIHFPPEFDKNQYEKFKKAFKIEAKIPEYLLNQHEPYLYEVGEGNFKGLRIEVFGPYIPNPHYVPIPKEVQERELMKDSLIRNCTLCELLWKPIAKKTVSFDEEKMRALFSSKGFNWYRCYSTALKLFGETKDSQSKP